MTKAYFYSLVAKRQIAKIFYENQILNCITVNMSVLHAFMDE